MKEETSENSTGNVSVIDRIKKSLPLILTVIFALYGLSKLRPPSFNGKFDYATFGKLPVQQKGRVKPLDTVARNSLLIMRGKQTVPDGPEASYFERLFYGKKSPNYLPAIEWFAMLALNPDQADEYKVFRIDHPEVLGLFGFEPGKAKYFSFNELFHSGEIGLLRGKMDKILSEVNAFVAENPDATDAEREKMREELIPKYKETEEKHKKLLQRVSDIEKAVRSIKLGEDLNRNNRLDDGEDLNKNGKLDPGPDSKKYTPYQRNLGHLYEAITLYDQLKNSLYPNSRRELFGESYENDLAVLELRKEMLAMGALDNEEKAVELLRNKPDAMRRIQDFQSSEAFLRGQSRFAPLGIVPPVSFEGTVSIENHTNQLKAKGGNLQEFLKPQDQVKIGTFSSFGGIWRENQLREKLIQSVENAESATLTNIHEGRPLLLELCFYLAFAGIAFAVFKATGKSNKLLGAIYGGSTLLLQVLAWSVLFGKPSATIENATLHNIDWTTLPESLLETRGQSTDADSANYGNINPYVMAYADMATAFRNNQHANFNGIVEQLTHDFTGLRDKQTHDLKNIKPEYLFNGAQPFVTCMALYLFSLILVFLSWLFWPRTLGKSAYGIAMVALVLHFLALVVRIWIQGRPPVTNLYSSAVFISLGAVCFGLLFERIYKNGIGTASATIVGFTSLVIAHNLAMDGDTMEMLQAVLDTNLWLATHVVCITLGYVAMFIAGILAILYVIRGILDKNFDKPAAKSISSMIYGVTCFAVFFSFVGTMLGGIWADQSWGRFWGWDPKENGALIIVIWSAIVLHARWGGIARDRGIAALAIFGNVVTAWSWFGTNLLQEGLHSYGFSDAGFIWLMRFIILQMLLIALAYFPQKLWRSEIGVEARAS